MIYQKTYLLDDTKRLIKSTNAASTAARVHAPLSSYKPVTAAPAEKAKAVQAFITVIAIIGNFINSGRKLHFYSFFTIIT